MSKSGIPYSNWAWNIAPGCVKKSPGCMNCWAEKMARRLQAAGTPGYQGLVNGNGWTGKINLLKGKLFEPMRMRKPRVIAVNFMGDLFNRAVSERFILRAFDAMFVADWHIYQVLTKLPGRAAEVLKGLDPLPHVYIGASVEDQPRANARWSAMAWLAQRGWKTWASSEPRLGAINWHGWEFLSGLVTGGESGPGARPLQPDWARADRDWCQLHSIPFMFKQWGPRGAGRELDERAWDELAWRTEKK